MYSIQYIGVKNHQLIQPSVSRGTRSAPRYLRSPQRQDRDPQLRHVDRTSREPHRCQLESYVWSSSHRNCFCMCYMGRNKHSGVSNQFISHCNFDRQLTFDLKDLFTSPGTVLFYKSIYPLMNNIVSSKSAQKDSRVMRYFVSVTFYGARFFDIHGR